ncbi:hypothetical protein [Embleya hyalina]|nr:hypothetical protein [Embleya hyalina]
MAILANFLVYGQASGDQIASVVGTMISVLAIVGIIPNFGSDRGVVTVDDILPEIRSNAKDLWTRERRDRGIERPDLLRVRIRDLDTGTYLVEPPPPPASPRYEWDFEEYLAQVTGLVLTGGVRRAVVYGSGGGGKTTLGVLLTTGIARYAENSGLVALYLPLASWSPSRETFETWFDHQVTASYPALRQLRPEPGKSLLHALTDSDRIMLILDGLDEVEGGQVPGLALRGIDTISKDKPLFVLSRPLPPDMPAPTKSWRLVLEDPRPADVLGYLGARLPSVGPGTRAHLNGLIHAIQANPGSDLAAMLGSTLCVDLLWRGSLRDPALPTRLRHVVQWHGGDAGRALLMETHVDQSLAGRISRPARRARVRKQAAYIAYKMRNVQPPAATLPWWRIHEAISPGIFGIAVILAVLPAYRLCLEMPRGLTRGFAIGSITGIVLGVCRGVRTKQAALTAFLATALAVVVEGTLLGEGPTAVIDGAEIAPAVGLVFLLRTRLTGSLVGGGFACLAVAASSALGVFLAQAAFGHADPDRSPGQVLLAVALGVVVATVSARILTRPNDPLVPSTAHVHGGLGPPVQLASAIVAAALVGAAGGFVGGVAHGPNYGLKLGIVFGVVVGVPVGLTGGLISWLNQPSPGHLPSITHLYRRDRALALFCVVSIAGVSTLMLWVTTRFLGTTLGDPHFTPAPVHGLLFGASIGLIVAGFNTAWPNYAICVVSFAVRRRLPWRLMSFLQLLHTCEILRRDGQFYSFRHRQLREHLADTHIP